MVIIGHVVFASAALNDGYEGRKASHNGECTHLATSGTILRVGRPRRQPHATSISKREKR